MQQFRPGGFNILPPVVKNLLIINGLFFLATLAFQASFRIDLIEKLGLYMIGSPKFEPYQFISHMFMHGSMMHIFTNMFALWMFGNVLENVWGPKRFLTYYLITGLGAAVLHLGVNFVELQALKSSLLAAGYTASDLQVFVNSGSYQTLPGTSTELLKDYLLKFYIPTVGASGAVFGILLAFGMLFPNSLIYLFFAIPIKAKYFVMGYGAIELYNGLSTPGSNIAHFAHLGGMLFGYLLIRYWKSKGKLY